MLRWLKTRWRALTTPPTFYKSVFLSYSHADKDCALAIARALQARGVSVWIDREELRVGDGLTSRLKQAIRAREFLVVLLSESSAHSVWVEREVEFALTLETRQRRIRVIPVVLKRGASLRSLSDRLWVDATEGSDESTVASLCRSICRYDFDDPTPAALRAALRNAEAVFEPLRALFAATRDQRSAPTDLVRLAHQAKIPNPDYSLALEAFAHEGHSKHEDRQFGMSYSMALCLGDMITAGRGGADNLSRLLRQGILDNEEQKGLFGTMRKKLPPDSFAAVLRLYLDFFRDDCEFGHLITDNHQSLGPHLDAVEAHFVEPGRGPRGYNIDAMMILLREYPERHGLLACMGRWFDAGYFSKPASKFFVGTTPLVFYLRASHNTLNAAYHLIADQIQQRIYRLLKGQDVRYFAEGMVMLYGFYRELESRHDGGWFYLEKLDHECLSRVYVDYVPNEFQELFFDLRTFLRAASSPTWTKPEELPLLRPWVSGWRAASGGTMHMRMSNAYDRWAEILGE